MEQIRGSGAKTQYARSIIAMDEPGSGDDNDIRVHIVKANLCREPQPLGMRMTDDGRAEWVEAPKAPGRTSKQVEAKKLLKSMLAAGPVAATAVDEQAELAGISPSTMDRSRFRLHERLVPGAQREWSRTRMMNSERRIPASIWRTPHHVQQMKPSQRTVRSQ
jgi:hypothetical protein